MQPTIQWYWWKYKKEEGEMNSENTFEEWMFCKYGKQIGGTCYNYVNMEKAFNAGRDRDSMQKEQVSHNSQLEIVELLEENASLKAEIKVYKDKTIDMKIKAEKLADALSDAIIWMGVLIKEKDISDLVEKTDVIMNMIKLYRRILEECKIID